ncbi:MAG: ATP-dependent helicase RecG [Rhodospirillales bacterium]|nr:ATP-dependent helicase RecG [Rhodospirillales bacterium]
MTDLLAALLAPIAGLPGVKKPELLAKAAGGDRVLDLLLHLPERVLHRPVLESLAAATEGAEVTLVLTPTAEPARTRSGPWRVPARCGMQVLDIISFSRAVWAGTSLARRLPIGEVRRVAGRLRSYAERWSLELDPEPLVEPPATIPEYQPIWPLTAGLTWQPVFRAVTQALAVLPALPEWHNAPLVAQHGWPGFGDALRALHAPAGEPGPKPRRRLAYDEVFAHQLAVGLVRLRNRARPGRALVGDGRLQATALAAFRHRPTASQMKAIAEINAGLAAPRRMLRLLQGDVGSGKTLVAAMAMLRAVEAGAQAALMAPTELLARQHLRTLTALCAPLPVALLAGSLKTAERRRTLNGLADGSIPIVVGTHALFQKGVSFRDLGLAVIDEQHRFGIEQRRDLAGKGSETDTLVMTATPIPRTLQLSQWGEMDVSRLTEKPAGRQPIATRLVSRERHAEVLARLGQAIARGERAYWVVRAIAGSERDDSVAAEDRFAELAQRFPGLVGLAHGMLEFGPREAALQDFAAGTTRILVATTVIEVGVDVPEASIMIIEQAERFGLAALHQLRGRVGRGAARSSCLLLHSAGLSTAELKRLSILRDTEDGFLIAEEDLRTRGAGEALGVRQAGHAGSRLQDTDDVEEYGALVATANRDAQHLLHQDPSLQSPRGEAAKLLLRLFDHDITMDRLSAG